MGVLEDATNKILTNILERTVRVETKIDLFNDVKDVAEEAKDTAYKALESTKSAHKRLDKIDKIVWWVGTTIIGAVILALVALVIKTE
ncbi:hemolysin XhlA family protein [Viridibacillus sp. NPDC093762]|uniref:hemolysin XhlA family protein n=1 Tax=Viridibacillus sp. NPDC093762 TaxID=3390720 RepID=UPI003D07AC19